MKLYLKNIGKIEEAFIELNGITVIAGENNTGKSTVGRALFAIFNSFANIQAQIEKERASSIENILVRFALGTGVKLTDLSHVKDMALEILKNADKYKEDTGRGNQELCDFVLQIPTEANKKEIEETVTSIRNVLNISEKQFVNTVVERNLDAEFYGQTCNIFAESLGQICLEIKNKKVMVDITGNGNLNVKNVDELSLHTEAIYLDDPFVLDDSEHILILYTSEDSDHRTHLKRKLFAEKRKGNLADEIIAKEKLEQIYEKISTVCTGEIIRGKRAEIGYRLETSNKVLNAKNLSTGLKTFAILKTLLMNGTIEQNGTIILDEPEIHLHPEWQLLFAELIVLIQKEFGVHVLLNTHSPYFLNAIEVYAAKYDVTDKCKYYLAELSGNSSIVRDVSENTEAIYSKLARPLQVLEDERGRL